MSIADVPSSAAPAPSPTLAIRRPGHAAMTYLLGELKRRAAEIDGLRAVPDDLRSWLIGAEGELMVGQELALLDPAWHVLHAVPAGSAGADIDHLLIGPAGVFVLNTKHHANRTIRVGTHVVWIDGFQQSNYQAELLRRCRQVRTVLFTRTNAQPQVVPLLVFVRPKRLDRSGPQQVSSVTSSSLVAHLQSLPPVLDRQAIDSLIAAAADPSTWGASAQVLDEPDPTKPFLELAAQPISMPNHTRPAAASRAAGRPQTRLARRVLGFAAALFVCLAVLPAVVAGILSLLGLYFQMLINR